MSDKQNQKTQDSMHLVLLHYFWFQEVSASFTRIFCPTDEQPFRLHDICLRLVRLTKYSVNANQMKNAIMLQLHPRITLSLPNYRCESTLRRCRQPNLALFISKGMSPYHSLSTIMDRVLYSVWHNLVEHGGWYVCLWNFSTFNWFTAGATSHNGALWWKRAAALYLLYYG